jgi:hypothetical protein
MNEGINLLEPNKKTSSVVILKHLQTTRVIVVSLLFLVSAISVILFILVAISPLPALKTQEQSLQQNLLQSKSDIVKLALINDRTDAISHFLATRQMVDQTLEAIDSNLSDNTTVSAIQTTSKSVIITIDSNSLQDLDNFINGMIVLVQQKKTFSQVTLVDLTNTATNNGYEITVKLTLL